MMILFAMTVQVGLIAFFSAVGAVAWKESRTYAWLYFGLVAVNATFLLLEAAGK